MKINEITNTLKTYIAAVRIKSGISIKTTLQTYSISNARSLLKHIYGTGNVFFVAECSLAVTEAGARTKVLDAGELQVKVLIDQEQKLKQQKNSLLLAKQ